MVTSLIAGVLAGYGIAMPFGAIGVLIVENGMRRGFRIGAAAGAGAATADLAYAAVAAIGGTALGLALEPIGRPLRVVAVGVLLGLGLRGLVAVAVRRTSGAIGSTSATGPLATYARFVGLTLLNPATVIYFAALILGLPDLGHGLAERAAFVMGAGVASLSWQTVLAAIGAIAHHRMPAGAQVAFSVVGNLIICAFAIGIAAGLP